MVLEEELIIADSKFVNNLNKFSSKDSKIIIKNSELIGNTVLEGKILTFMIENKTLQDTNLNIF